MTKTPNKTAKRILCLDCQHFRITWEPSHPRACKAMGFKTKNWPCVEVIATSGEPCLKFSKKPNTSGNDGNSTQGDGNFYRKV